MPGRVTIIVGGQWGDEGKGKWIDILAEKADVVARFQGGNNAGHTLFIDGKKHVLHQIPSGIFHKHCCVALGAGCVVNPEGLWKEIDALQKITDVSPDRFWLSVRAHVITPWHVELDGRLEQRNAIGTTKKGIGPTYAEKAARSSIRLGHYIDTRKRQSWIQTMMENNRAFAEFYTENAKLWSAFEEVAEKIRPYACDAEGHLRKAIYSDKKVLLEGAQGTMLDLDHGTYPFVTSSSTAASGALASIGFSPRSIEKIVGVAKAYTTRVGAGPFPSETQDAVGADIAKRGHEFGSTTGRARRVGWFDAVAFRYAKSINGFDGMILNKMDILTGVDPVKIAVAYQHPELGKITEFPWDPEVLDQCKPIYESYPGWTEQIPQTGTRTDLPRNALAFVEAIEKASETPVLMIGTGPERHQSLQ